MQRAFLRFIRQLGRAGLGVGQAADLVVEKEYSNPAMIAVFDTNIVIDALNGVTDADVE